MAVPPNQTNIRNSPSTQVRQQSPRLNTNPTVSSGYPTPTTISGGKLPIAQISSCSPEVSCHSPTDTDKDIAQKKQKVSKSESVGSDLFKHEEETDRYGYIVAFGEYFDRLNAVK